MENITIEQKLNQIYSQPYPTQLALIAYLATRVDMQIPNVKQFFTNIKASTRDMTHFFGVLTNFIWHHTQINIAKKQKNQLDWNQIDSDNAILEFAQISLDWEGNHDVEQWSQDLKQKWKDWNPDQHLLYVYWVFALTEESYQTSEMTTHEVQYKNTVLREVSILDFNQSISIYSDFRLNDKPLSYYPVVAQNDSNWINQELQLNQNQSELPLPVLHTEQELQDYKKSFLQSNRLSQLLTLSTLANQFDSYMSQKGIPEFGLESDKIDQQLDLYFDLLSLTVVNDLNRKSKMISDWIVNNPQRAKIILKKQESNESLSDWYQMLLWFRTGDVLEFIFLVSQMLTTMIETIQSHKLPKESYQDVIRMELLLEEMYLNKLYQVSGMNFRFAENPDSHYFVAKSDEDYEDVNTMLDDYMKI